MSRYYIGDEDITSTAIASAATGSSAMAAKFGRIEEFSPDSDSIKSYLERVQLYFDANSVPQAKQVPILLSSVGATTYSLLSNLTAPEAPLTKTLQEISAILRKHYEPKRATIAERFHFHKREQAAGESIAEFEAALRKLAVHCDFGEYLNQALRNRLVCGLCNVTTQRRLLSETDLTHTKAMELAQAIEAAEQNTKSFKPPEPSIHRISQRQSPNSREGHDDRPSSNSRERRPCFRCGRSNHDEVNCKFRDATCHRCGKVGHIAPVCRSKTVQYDSKFDSGDRARVNHITQIEDAVETTQDCDDGEYFLF